VLNYKTRNDRQQRQKGADEEQMSKLNQGKVLRNNKGEYK